MRCFRQGGVSGIWIFNQGTTKNIFSSFSLTSSSAPACLKFLSTPPTIRPWLPPATGSPTPSRPHSRPPTMPSVHLVRNVKRAFFYDVTQTKPFRNCSHRVALVQFSSLAAAGTFKRLPPKDSKHLKDAPKLLKRFQTGYVLSRDKPKLEMTLSVLDLRIV